MTVLLDPKPEDTFRMLDRVLMTPAMLVSENLPELHAAWSPAVTYAKGDRVLYNLRYWESLINSNIGQTPGADATKWLDAAPANVQAMFDDQVGTFGVGPSPIVVQIKPSTNIDTVHFFGLLGWSLRLEVTDPIAGLVFDETINLDGSAVFDWWSYFTAPFDQLEEASFFSIPAYYNATFKFTLSGTGDVKVGGVFFGQSVNVGAAINNVGFGAKIYSEVKEDEFGIVALTEGPTSNRFEPQALVDRANMRRLHRLFKKHINVPTVLSVGAGADDLTFTATLGVLRRWDMQINSDTPTQATISFEILGMT